MSVGNSLCCFQFQYYLVLHKKIKSMTTNNEFFVFDLNLNLGLRHQAA